ncbi:hypothetical protein K458DRAFT_170541 [Lentithecium fluviatile CBS 122367]|uniref:Uncharacterized protein n=1 Tax=Lentithecium fluviatile CBS 122367 TaxID=1168545 RepID=A0A6G1JB96_9PLEO|nr:hypothetical protein K458DRAFT_170541 [Lentithecium fluviatile CBS 122367]
MAGVTRDCRWLLFRGFTGGLFCGEEVQNGRRSAVSRAFWEGVLGSETMDYDMGWRFDSLIRLRNIDLAYSRTTERELIRTCWHESVVTCARDDRLLGLACGLMHRLRAVYEVSSAQCLIVALIVSPQDWDGAPWVVAGRLAAVGDRKVRSVLSQRRGERPPAVQLATLSVTAIGPECSERGLRWCSQQAAFGCLGQRWNQRMWVPPTPEAWGGGSTTARK